MNRNAIKPKSVEDYLNLPYTIEIIRDYDPENPGWVARVVELPGCLTQADSFEELEEMIVDAMRAWISVAIEDSLPIPEPREVEEFSGKFLVRVPKSLHRELVGFSSREGVSLNQFIVAQLARSAGSFNAGLPSRSGDISVSSDDVPLLNWERLREPAARLLLIQGYKLEAFELSEQIFASWMDQYIDQAEIAIERAEFLEALQIVRTLRSGLEQLCGHSPVVRALCATFRLLENQIISINQYHTGVMEQHRLLQRTLAQVRSSNEAYTIPEPASSSVQHLEEENFQGGYRIFNEVFRHNS